MKSKYGYEFGQEIIVWDTMTKDNKRIFIRDGRDGGVICVHGEHEKSFLEGCIFDAIYWSNHKPIPKPTVRAYETPLEVLKDDTGMLRHKEGREWAYTRSYFIGHGCFEYTYDGQDVVVDYKDGCLNWEWLCADGTVKPFGVVE